MTSSRFFIQGLSPRSHGQELRELLELPGLEQAVFLVSYVRSEGALMILDLLKRHRGKVKIAAGVANNVTTYQGLKHLYDAIGPGLYTVETGRGNLIYHPKVFYATSPTRSLMLTTSANLTAGGLQRNIEAGHLLTIDHSHEEERKPALEIARELDDLLTRFPANVEPVTDPHVLEIMVQDGRLIDEGGYENTPTLQKQGRASAPATPRVPPMRVKRPRVKTKPDEPT